MCAGAITPRYEWRLLILDLPKRLRDILHALDTGRIAFGSDQHEVIVHHRITPHAFAFGEKLFLRRLRMDENNVGIAAPASVERLSGALRDDFRPNASFLLEDWKQVLEQTAVLCRCGRSNDGTSPV